MDCVLDSEDPSEANGVKQGCALAPTLFSMFAAMPTDGFRGCYADIHVRHRFDEKLFNSRCLQAVAKAKKTVIRDFLFADECALDASNAEEMQLEIDRFSSACDNFGRTISTKMTRVMFQPAS